MTNLKSITELPVAESAEGLSLIVNDHGSAKQIPASEVGAQADFAETDENSPAFIKNKPQVAQSDWAETDETSASFIKNKPVRELMHEWNFSPDDCTIMIEDEDVDVSWMTVESDDVGFEIICDLYGVDVDEEVAPTGVDESGYIVLPDTTISFKISDTTISTAFAKNAPYYGMTINMMFSLSEIKYPLFQTDNGVENGTGAYMIQALAQPSAGSSYFVAMGETLNPFKSVKIYKVIK